MMIARPLVFFLSVTVAASKDQSSELKETTALLDDLLAGYHRFIRPSGQPTNVQINIHVRSMGPISEKHMSFAMECYFRQSWVDSRLRHNSSLGTLALSSKILDKLWRPDTFFLNGKRSHLHHITTANRLVRISREGVIFYSQRLTIEAHCLMKLQKYPMDVQKCSLIIGSFAYDANEMKYFWKNGNESITTASDMKLSQFNLIDTPFRDGFLMKRGPANFSFLEANFVFERHVGYYVFQLYLPCSFLVIISWVAFWINRESTGDRVALGIMTVLTMAFLIFDARASLPAVDYITAQDWYFYISFSFVIASLTEFAVVHHFTKKGFGEKYVVQPDKPPPLKKTIRERLMSIPELFNFEAGNLRQRRNQVIPMVLLNAKENKANEETNEDDCLFSSKSRRTKMTEFPKERLIFPTSKINKSSTTEDTDRKQPNSNKRRQSKVQQAEINSVSKIDQFSRVMFPFVYVVIQVIYWWKFYYSGGG